MLCSAEAWVRRRPQWGRHRHRRYSGHTAARHFVVRFQARVPVPTVDLQGLYLTSQSKESTPVRSDNMETIISSHNYRCRWSCAHFKSRRTRDSQKGKALKSLPYFKYLYGNTIFATMEVGPNFFAIVSVIPTPCRTPGAKGALSATTGHIWDMAGLYLSARDDQNQWQGGFTLRSSLRTLLYASPQIENSTTNRNRRSLTFHNHYSCYKLYTTTH